jgi:hypothetical protein
MDPLRAIDAAGPVEKLGFPVDTMTFINGKGKRLGRIPMAAQRPDGQESQMMPRADSYVALGKLARDRGARVNYRKKFVDTTSTAGGGVKARFADGTTAKGDLPRGLRRHSLSCASDTRLESPSTTLRAGSQHRRLHPQLCR